MSTLRIVGAAVRYQGKTYGGVRHGQIMREIWESNPYAKIRQEHQGFLAHDGRFLDRHIAGEVAYAAGQTTTLKTDLLSEHLW